MCPQTDVPLRDGDAGRDIPITIRHITLRVSPDGCRLRDGDAGRDIPITLRYITCVPRRMFPFVMVTLEGLSPTLLYSVHPLFRRDISALVVWA